MSNTQGEAGDAAAVIIEAAVSDNEAALSRFSPDPRDMVRAMNGRISKLTFPTTERAQAAASILRSYTPQFEKLLWNFDYLGVRRLVGEVESSIRPLTCPPPVRGFPDELRRIVTYGQNQSWTINALEALRWFFRNGDEITDIRAASVTIGGRLIKRSDVRGKLDASVARIDAEREKRAVEREAINDESVARGGVRPYETL